MKVIIPSELSGDEQWRYNDEYVPLSEVEARDARIAELEAALRRVLAKYEGENPARTADYHLSGCDCMRCVIDDARAALSTKEDGT